MNSVNIVGNLTGDVTIRDLGDNKVASFTVAVDRPLSKEKREQLAAENKPTADFIRVQTWNGQAESCAQYLSKGKKVAVDGSLRTSTYEKEGQTHYAVEVAARRVEFLSPAPSNGPQVEQKPAGGQDDDGIPF